VLALDFSSLDCSTVDALTRTLNEKLLETINQFIEKCTDVLEEDTPHFVSEDGVSRLERLADFLGQRELKLYVFIDEYDVGVSQALLSRELTNQLTVSEGAEQLTASEGVKHSSSSTTMSSSSSLPAAQSLATKHESVFKRFFSALKATLELGSHRVFMTGVTPLATTSGFNVARDLAHRLEFSMMLGLSQSEVWSCRDWRTSSPG
jgi:hypothetical protein